MHRSDLRFFLFAFSLIITQFSFGQDWPQFRGPHGNGHADAMKLPTQWSESENVDWKTELPGRGWSSPVISNNQVWMTSAIETENGPVELIAICVDKTSGQIQHQVSLFKLDKDEKIHVLNSYASPTPVISADRVFCHFGNYGTACLNLKSGMVIWKTNRFHYDTQDNGPGASPVVWKNLLLFNCDGRDVQFAVALEQKSGKVVWKVERSGKLHDNKDFQKSYCTPAILQTEGVEQLVSPAADWVYSYDPKTGRELWKVNYGQLGFSTVPKPVFHGGTAFILTSYMKSKLLAIDCLATKKQSSGSTTATIKWTSSSNMPQKPSLLVIEQNLYAINDKGILTCLRTDTGKTIFQHRIRGNFSASPIYAGGHLYFCDQSGETTVLKHGNQYQQVAKNQLDGKLMASPAVADGSIFLRTDKAIYRIGQE